MPKSDRSPQSKPSKSRRNETEAQKPTEVMVRQSGDPFRLMVESVKDYAIFMLDQQGYISTWNLGAENIKGYKADEIIGKHFSIFYPEEDLKWDKPGYELKVATEVGRFEDEGWRIRKDGTRFWANVIITALRDKDGVLRGFGKVTRDLTERKNAEEQRLQLAREQVARSEAEAASRAKDEFLATISHELRTPLNAILGWGRMLRNVKLNEEHFTRGLDTIERNAKLQAQLIDDLLDVSRIISGKLRLTVMPVELAPVIEAAVDSIRPAADAKNIRIQVLLDLNAGLISGDSDRLQQVVWNLLSNAVKFTEKGGRIQVTLQRVDSHVEITVSDTGRGISAEFLPYVFDRFRQADSSITRKHGGLGLGLAIVRHLVELHGGSVQAQSPGEGQGATFTVQLPIIVAHGAGRFALDANEMSPSGVRDQRAFDSSPSLEGVNILIVDDEADARGLLTVILEQRKAQVTAVASPTEAYETLEWLRPDLIISDIGMPGEDGYSFIRNVRVKEARERQGWRPAIALTAHARVEDRLRALSAGYQAHVAKPVEPAELVAVIASFVRPLS
jgi:PAS domain S-box-containing protein